MYLFICFIIWADNFLHWSQVYVILSYLSWNSFSKIKLKCLYFLQATQA